MRNSNRRTHPHIGVGRRDAPRPPASDELRTRFGYVIGNPVRHGCLPTAPSVAALHLQEDAAAATRAGIIRRVQARSNQGVVVGNLAPDSPLLLAQLQVRELTAANRRKDEFLALLAHELRSPLCAIGYAAGLLRKHTTESVPQSLQVLIERQVSRMTHLVDEVLDVSRVSNGLLNLSSERVDLRVAVANALETLQSDTERRHQRLSTRLPETAVWVMGDERRLEQVFVNLIANASRYTDQGGKLTTWLYVEAGEAVVRIRDSGIGIAPESLPSIFELFRQAHASDPRSKAGLGVGLALVRQLVELHGGGVTAASEGVGRGSEFTIRLPILTASVPEEIEADTQQEAESSLRAAI